ncbi:MAG: hypothetical protein HY275_04680 [Gemmatimonadetes bacterium]|nr:hypothetical protein [Gemmatimonadota bacterium]
MSLVVRVEPRKGAAPKAKYRWDADTEILTVHIAKGAAQSGLTGGVELEGQDGSWLLLDIEDGALRSIEVAVWPDVRSNPALVPPAECDEVMVTVPARASQPGIAAMEVSAAVRAEADPKEEVIHFVLHQRRTRR